MLESLQKNAARFTGFADTYDASRPKMPAYPAEIITRYLRRTPETVVDFGCGTGLSLLIWKDRAQRIIGVEPSGDMLKEAQAKKLPNASFVQVLAHDTGLPDGCADAVVCSQSFHWMEPSATLAEANRILKPDGVFAAVDCDWPPVSDVRAELAYRVLRKREQTLERELSDINDTFVRFPKEKHLENIEKSGHFRYVREILFANREDCTAGRLCSLMLSQGGLQTILKRHPGLLEPDIERFCEEIRSIFGERTFPVDFSYRMRIGVK